METQISPAAHQDIKIDINGKEYTVRSRRYTVVELKSLAQIPLADELEQVVHQRLIPLKDDASVVVEACEWFVSHPRDCQSS
jgi:hypothetical protein